MGADSAAKEACCQDGTEDCCAWNSVENRADEDDEAQQCCLTGWKAGRLHLRADQRWREQIDSRIGHQHKDHDSAKNPTQQCPSTSACILSHHIPPICRTRLIPSCRLAGSSACWTNGGNLARLGKAGQRGYGLHRTENAALKNGSRQANAPKLQNCSDTVPTLSGLGVKERLRDLAAAA